MFSVDMHLNTRHWIRARFEAHLPALTKVPVVALITPMPFLSISLGP
jgi:hypothetical protein